MTSPSLPDGEMLAKKLEAEIAFVKGDAEAWGVDYYKDLPRTWRLMAEAAAFIRSQASTIEALKAERDESSNETIEIVARWMMENRFATGHGDTVPNLLWELKWQVDELRTRALAAESTLATSRAEVERLTKLLDMKPGWSLEKGYHNGDEEGDYGWIVYEVRGGRSDREWREIGFGPTPLEALMGASAGDTQ